MIKNINLWFSLLSNEARKMLASKAIILLVPLIIGSFGYMLTEKLPFHDALYMTIITIATVGYGDIVPLTTAGRWFTIVLVMSNLGIFAYALSSISATVLNSELRERFKKLKKIDMIKSLKQHVIICGYGRNGREASETLKSFGIPHVVIDTDFDAKFVEIENMLYFIEGNATDEIVLIEAGIKQASALIATLPKDADNVYIVLSAKEHNAQVNIISRAMNDAAVNKLKRAGANNVIMPDKIGGAHMANLIVQPDIKEFIDIISTNNEVDYQLFELNFEDVKGDKLPEFKTKLIELSNVLAIKNNEGKYEYNPNILKQNIENCKVIFLTHRNHYKVLNEYIAI